MSEFSLIVPVYKNEDTLDALVKRVASLSQRLDGGLEAVFVVDGSPDRSYECLRDALPHQEYPSELIRLSRNFGSFAAIRMGLSVGEGPYYAVMAADLQEPEDLIYSFFRTLETGEADIAVGIRETRDDPAMSKWSSRIYWSVYRRLVQRETPRGGLDVFGCNRAARDALLSLDESNSSLVGLLLWLGFRRKDIPYCRLARDGKSGWNFRRKLRYMLDSAYAFSDLPIMLLTAIGALGTIVSTTLALVVLAARLAGYIDVKGYTPIILALFISTSFILLALGVIGGYVWRAFENTKRRPLYIALSRDSYHKDLQH